MLKQFVPFVLSLILLFACQSKQAKISPTEESITESVYASGIIKSKNQYQVFSTVNGLITEVMVTEGDRVKKGEAILTIAGTAARLNTENARIAADYASIKANTEKLEELRNNIDLAKASMDNAASLLERQQKLWAQQIGSRNEVDQRDLSFKNAVTAYNSAMLRYTQLQKQVSFQQAQSQKSLQISETQAGDYTVKSDNDGRIYTILKEKGEMVNTQSPVAVLGDAQTFIVELQVDEYDIARIQPGQKLLLSMDSYKGQVFEAVVQKIDPFMSERSRSFTVEAAFIKQPPLLYPNLTCEANIIIHEKAKALTIPRACLLEGGYVLLGNKQKKKVVPGLQDYRKVEILDGLTIHDIILTPAP